jgi:hypothetical protein
VRGVKHQARPFGRVVWGKDSDGPGHELQ